MSEPQMVVFGGKGGKKPGRPRATEEGSSISTWLPASDHDLLIKLAKKRDISISKFVRIVLQREVGKK